MTRLGIVADDVTGATTVAALLAAAGVRNVVLLDQSYIESQKRPPEAVVVSSDSRPLPPGTARSRVAAATRALRDAGAEQFSKRTDTTMRGGIGYEIEGMLSELPGDYVAVAVPAMPQSKRIVVGGYSVIDSILLERTGVAQDVRTPVTESHLPTLLAGQLSQPVAAIGMESILSGADALQEAFVRGREDGNRVFVVDSISLDDVALVAQVLVELGWNVVCVDPGAFTTAYALAKGIDTRRKIDMPPLRIDPAPEDRGIVTVVAGSATTVTTGQLAPLIETPGTTVLDVDVEPLICGGEACIAEYDRILAEADAVLSAGELPRVVILGLHSSLTGNLVDMDAIEDKVGLPRGEGASQVSARLGKLGRLVMDRIGVSRLAGVYLTGGDVMINTVRAMDAEGIALEGYVIPQSDQGLLVGGPFNGLPVVGKGGLTGGPHTALHIVNRIFDERKIA